MSDNIQYLTQQGYNELKEKFINLKEHKIPEIAEHIDTAKQQGDLSENAEYHQAKEDMAWAQGRLLELRQILDNAQIIENNNQNDIVGIGNTIKFKTQDDKEKEYIIVGPQEADPLEGRISNESPMGKAFLGHKVGESVTVETPAGKQIYKISEIS